MSVQSATEHKGSRRGGGGGWGWGGGWRATTGPPACPQRAATLPQHLLFHIRVAQPTDRVGTPREQLATGRQDRSVVPTVPHTHKCARVQHSPQAAVRNNNKTVQPRKFRAQTRVCAPVGAVFGLHLLPLLYGYRDCGVRWGVYGTGWGCGCVFLRPCVGSLECMCIKTKKWGGGEGGGGVLPALRTATATTAT